MSNNAESPPASGAAHGSGALTWTQELPQRRGWWWWKQNVNGIAKPLEVWDVRENGKAWWQVSHPYGPMTLRVMKERWPDMRWAGPLVEPPDEWIEEPRQNDPDQRGRAADSQPETAA